MEQVYSYNDEAFGFIKNIFSSNKDENAIKNGELVKYFEKISTDLESIINYYNQLTTIEDINIHKSKILNIIKGATNTRSSIQAINYLMTALSNIKDVLDTTFIAAVIRSCSANILKTNLSGADLIATKVLGDLSKIVSYSLDFLNIASSMEGTLNEYKNYKENVERDVFTYVTLVRNYDNAFKNVPDEMFKLKGSVFNPEVDDISVGAIIFNNTRSDLIMNSKSNFTYNPIYRWKIRQFDNATEEYRLNHIKRQNIENKIILLQQRLGSDTAVDISRLEKEIRYYNNELAVLQGKINRYEREVEAANRY